MIIDDYARHGDVRAKQGLVAIQFITAQIAIPMGRQQIGER